LKEHSSRKHVIVDSYSHDGARLFSDYDEIERFEAGMRQVRKHCQKLAREINQTLRRW